jgi:sensor histidine kinase YesM
MLLENTDQVVPLANEIEMLGLYISLAKPGYKNKFDYHLFVDEHLNTNETIIPTLLLQPIVENAIIHGLAPKDKKGILKVYFVKKGKQLECIVEDNGIGRTAQKQPEIQRSRIEGYRYYV